MMGMEEPKRSGFAKADSLFEGKAFHLQPRFCVIYHPVRVELGLSSDEYIIIDSINTLSHNQDHPWCTQSKEKIATFTGISERTVYRAIQKGIEKGLIEKNERGDLRSTRDWFERVVVYRQKTTR